MVFNYKSIDPWPILSNPHEGGKGNTNNLVSSTCKYICKKDSLGDGHFSTVKECINRQTNDIFAMKLVRKDLLVNKIRLIQREVGILRYLRQEVVRLEQEPETDNKQGKTDFFRNTAIFEGHHHILQLFDFFETKDHIVLVTQLCNKRDLYDVIIESGKLDLERQVKPYTACLLSALQFLHDQGIVHRDIKAENILFRKKDVAKVDKFTENINPHHLLNSKYDLASHDLIIADFGLATTISNVVDLREYVGTISYISPQIVRCKGAGESCEPYDYKVDIWALGVLSYFMGFGYMPFDCETDKETLDCIATGDYYLEETDTPPGTEDELFISFLKQTFIVNSKERPSVHQLACHPFVSKFFATINGSYDNKIPLYNNENISTGNINNSSNNTSNLNNTLGLTSKSKRCKSSTSLRRLGSPSRTSSIYHTGATNFTSSSSNNSSTTSIKDMATSRKRHDQEMEKISKIRDTLKRTLSMKALSQGEPLSNKNLHSTFKIGPGLPDKYLMNGVYSVTPESSSNFNTSPELSRTSSQLMIIPGTSTTVSTSNGSVMDNDNNKNALMNSFGNVVTPSLTVTPTAATSVTNGNSINANPKLHETPKFII
ncbi:related to Serine/threonine-protein kinase TDA1 [Saccharomycodes ludwigii]|uniref:Related to Serine/threonine-protein kinase TDA1 n=1 Tax=Saccharomycodes ludwigii TaxID=36035 RepID=A0A376B2G7_9ASCO|nr:hypothetical protein SCDLUD_004863 [Saccharomycodes ludwigii]KAH3899420.1 hypothetical protein SCDLUD_004863 [Saccharomycodes ludwigii]SSD58863.1 related to Serine/threonine-protein kinase TDA1 [Saccharomycodes ludwigii]